MTPSQLPATQISPEQAILLPAAPQLVVEAASEPRVRRGADRLVTFLVVVLAFLAASFVARNSDLWFHLATGRLLARGQYSFGADPFAYTTEHVYWANHAWLYDLGLYGLYGLVGGTGLVVLKALLVAALAALLLSMRRPDSSGWLPAIGTALAILAMSPRLLLQPACVSYFFLGLTLWLLWRRHARAVAGRPWALLLVFVMWVNVDEWFFLGPLLVALFWLGERLGGERRTPGWLVPAGLAACLLNPHTYHVFTLPAELLFTLPPWLFPVGWTSGLRQDVRFQTAFASPWLEYLGAAKKFNPAALAYLALIALGPLSFALHWRALRGWRLTIWLPFAVLAALQMRLIPFFAVVAAPITALNLQDFVVALSDKETRRTRPSSPLLVSLSHCLLVFGLLALLGPAWLGWLAGYGREERRVAWGVQADPSLQQAAETLHQWRRDGLLTEGERVFALGPETAAYAAWFSPGEKQFFDHRYPLFAPVASDYEAACRALQPELFAVRSPAPRAERERAKGWRQALHDHGVAVVVYHDRDPQNLFGVLRRLAADPAHWTLLHVAGTALIVGRNEARPAGAFAPLAFDADRLAFGPQDERARHALPAAPDEESEPLPRQPGWEERLSPRAPPPPAWESAAATVYLQYFDDTEVAQRQQQWRSSLTSYAASLAGLGALPSAAPQTAFQLMSSRPLLFPQDAGSQFLVRNQLGPYFAHLVERSPALPLLAVRAARRAVAANPRDAKAWFRLGQAYLLLRNFTCERSIEGMVPPLGQVRHVQIVTALEQAVRLDPDLEEAHHQLAALYGQRNYLDLALEHQREELRITRPAGRRPGESAEVFARRLEFYETDTAKLTDVVQDGRAKYAAGAGSLQGERLTQADMAFKLGLARQAVEDVLLASPAELLGPAGIKLELEMLLQLGRVDDVRPILADRGLRASKHGLRQTDIVPPQDRNGRPLYPMPYRWPAYEWLRVLQSAAVGDYAQAQADLRAIRAEVGAARGPLQQQARGFEGRALTFLPGLLSGHAPLLPALAAQSLRRAWDEKLGLELAEAAVAAQQADLCVLEGLLALEQGNTEAARSGFAEAQQLDAQPSSAPIRFAGAPIAAFYLSKVKGKE